MEKETLKWQNRWEESTKALKLMKENHDKLQGELTNSEQSLEKMKGLCRALQTERKELFDELKQKYAEKSAAAASQLADANANSNQLSTLLPTVTSSENKENEPEGAKSQTEDKKQES